MLEARNAKTLARLGKPAGGTMRDMARTNLPVTLRLLLEPADCSFGRACCQREVIPWASASQEGGGVVGGEGGQESAFACGNKGQSGEK